MSSITISKAARWFGYGKGTIRRWVKEGRVRRVGTGLGREMTVSTEDLYTIEREKNSVKEL